MNMTDPVADLLTRIRNGVRARIPKVDVPASKLKVEIARILKDEGYISNFKSTEDGKQGVIRVYLKYGPGMERVITDLQRVSPPRLPHLLRQGRHPPGLRRPRHQHPVHLARSHDRPGGGSRPAWAARSSATSGKEPNAMSRVGRKVIAVPKDVKVQVADRALSIQGPKGKLETPVPPGISFKLDGRRAQLSAHERRAPAAGLPRPRARPGPERGQGRDRGLQQGARHRGRRLQGRGRRGQGGVRPRLLPPGGVQDPRGDQDRGGQGHTRGGLRHRPPEGRPGGGGDPAACASPIPTSRRGSATWARS